MAHILVVDDIRNVRRTLALQLREAGHQIVEAEGGREAVDLVAKSVYDVVVTDLRMGPVDGLEVLRATKRVSPRTEVIVTTAYGTVESGVEAIKLGAFDYLTKPVKPQEMEIVLAKALEKRRLGDELERLRAEGGEPAPFLGGRSPAWQELMETVRRVASTDATVLLLGESGSGKEVVASSIHQMSSRREEPLVRVNLGAIPESLQESELFGHVRGAFTGAVSARKGLFMEASGATLFLDEVGETALATQVALLRALATSEIRPIGADRACQVDCRVLLATNADLPQLVKEKRFREDLYHRINVFPIRVPPLREQAQDIPDLARHLLHRLSVRLHRTPVVLAPDAEEALVAYRWPGNIRELENVLERALILVHGPEIRAENLRLWERAEAPAAAANPSPPTRLTLDEVERAHVLAVLDDCQGQRQRAAEVLGISRATLFRKLRDYGVQ